MIIFNIYFSKKVLIIPNELKAVIFDMDGVITDTVHYHFLSWQRLAADENIPFSETDNEQLLGRSRRDSLQIFLKGRVISEAETQELLQRKNQYYLELIQDLSTKDLLPGVHELLLQLQALGLKLAVASSSRNAKIVIEKLGIQSFFKVIADGSYVTKAKPAPDLFLMTAEQLRVLPQNSLVIEDSAAGVASALTAKMKVIGIGPMDRVGQANWRFDSIAQINFDKILTRFNQAADKGEYHLYEN